MAQKPREISDLESLIVEKIREHLGVSQRSAAWLTAQTGIPESTLSKTLNGKRASNLVELQHIVEALGLRLSEVVAEAEASQTATVVPLPVRERAPEPDFYAMAALDGGYDPEQEQN